MPSHVKVGFNGESYSTFFSLVPRDKEKKPVSKMFITDFLKMRSVNAALSQDDVSKTATFLVTTWKMSSTIPTLKFFSIGVFFHGHWWLMKTQDIYLQLCMWDCYHILLIALLVFARLLLNEIYHLIKLLFHWKLPFDWLMM